VAKAYPPEDLVRRVFMLVVGAISIQIAVIVTIMFL
jgi:hypothetical protein